jgi:putative ABC transport system ATP-binding protein
MENGHNIVRVSEVTRTFRMGTQVVQALKGVDLSIQAGEYLSIMGPSVPARARFST